MTTIERRGRLTYKRLISSLERHEGAIVAQLPDLKDAGRLQDLQRAINDALTTARAEMSNAQAIAPALLKQELKAHIADIHQRHDALDEARAQAPGGTQSSVFAASTASGNSTLSLASSQQIPAPRRTRGTRDSSKENAVPSAALSSQPVTHKISAVRKTPIIKRAKSSKPSTNTGIKKRPARTTRSKAAVPDVTATRPPTTDDADRDVERDAAAAALIGLAAHSPESSFTSLSSSNSSSSFITPSTSGKKRTYSVYKDDTSSQPNIHPSPQGFPSSSPAPKRRMLAPTEYAEVPVLAQGLSLSEAFALGVEYAVQHLPSHLESDGEELRAWVEEQLGLQIPLSSKASSNMGVGDTGGGMTARLSGGKKGFWDVV
jgi:hypothetical protein